MASLRHLLGDAIQSHQTIAMLDLGNQRSRLLISEDDGGHPQPVFHQMSLGIDLLATRTFKQRMPTEVQLEHCIMLVEDAVMPIARLIPPGNVFVTRDPLLLEVGQQALGMRDLTSGMANQWPPAGTQPQSRGDAV